MAAEAPGVLTPIRRTRPHSLQEGVHVSPIPLRRPVWRSPPPARADGARRARPRTPRRRGIRRRPKGEEGRRLPVQGLGQDSEGRGVEQGDVHDPQAARQPLARDPRRPSRQAHAHGLQPVERSRQGLRAGRHAARHRPLGVPSRGQQAPDQDQERPLPRFGRSRDGRGGDPVLCRLGAGEREDHQRPEGHEQRPHRSERRHRERPAWHRDCPQADAGRTGRLRQGTQRGRAYKTFPKNVEIESCDHVRATPSRSTR